MKRSAIVAAVVGVTTVLLLVYWRGLYLSHAVMIGVAVTALAYSAQLTVARLRSLFRDRR